VVEAAGEPKVEDALSSKDEAFSDFGIARLILRPGAAFENGYPVFNCIAINRYKVDKMVFLPYSILININSVKFYSDLWDIYRWLTRKIAKS
jgi:hypothetical protein